MTRWSALAHRRLDEAADEAEARDGGESFPNFGSSVLLPRTRDRTRDMRSMDRPREPRVLLMQLAQRTSAKGTAYLTGWLGKAKLVGFKGEPDQWGNETWLVYAAEPSPRQEEKAPANPSAHRQDDHDRGRHPAYHASAEERR